VNSKVFTVQDQHAFAQLSGDYNPIHVDDTLARRLIFGSSIVHGVHAVLWAVERWIETQERRLDLRSLQVNFVKPIGVGDSVFCSIAEDATARVGIRLLVNDRVTTHISFTYADSTDQGSIKLHRSNPEPHECKVLTSSDLDTAHGSIPLFLNPEAAAEIFPFLMRRLSSNHIALLLATSRLVGMECPGLHSILSGLEMAFGAEQSVGSTLDYSVSSFDSRFNCASVEIRSSKMEGKIRAFLRPPQQKQKDYSELRTLVGKSEFAGQHALIIGGTRGLGEASAKLLCAGGANVTFTYFRGAADAQRLVSEVKAEGGSIRCFFLDVRESHGKLSSIAGWGHLPTHLYYFATPFIFSATSHVFSTRLFQEFCSYYVVGFANLVSQLIEVGLRKIFYPSTIAVRDFPPNMGEYLVAKIAGENYCAFLEKNTQGLTIYKPRLPRLRTDQTVSLLHVDAQEPMTVILRHLRKFRELSAKKDLSNRP